MLMLSFKQLLHLLMCVYGDIYTLFLKRCKNLGVSKNGFCPCCGAERLVEQHDPECVWYGEYDNLKKNGEDRIEEDDNQ